jgi:hypothetical protein
MLTNATGKRAKIIFIAIPKKMNYQLYFTQIQYDDVF